MIDDSYRGQLEAESAFLLASLDDLDAEHADGNIDDANYMRLRDDYTARAAQVFHRLAGDAVESDAPYVDAVSARHRGLVGVVVGVVGFVVVVSVALAYGLGARLPGQTLTGGQSDSAKAAAGGGAGLAALRGAVKATPNDAGAHLALARALMGQQDGPDALKEFAEAALLDPKNPEPFTYSGWLVRLQGFPDQALQLLDKAISVDEQYADARAFKGIILLRDKHDLAGAIAQFQRYLVRAPVTALADQVRTLLAQAVEAQRSSIGTSSSTATTAPPPSAKTTTSTNPKSP